MGEQPKLQVTAKRRILKFAEGADPRFDKPFDIIEENHVYEGEEAIQLLEQHGMTKEQAIEIASKNN